MSADRQTRIDAFAHVTQCRLGTTATGVGDQFVRGLAEYVAKWAEDLREEVARREHADAVNLAFINEHRVALGYDEFEELTPKELARHLKLVNDHAAYGNDPWATEKKS